MKGFESEMQNQKKRSRSAAIQETGDWTELKHVDGSEFTGYDSLVNRIRITRYRKITQN